MLGSLFPYFYIYLAIECGKYKHSYKCFYFYDFMVELCWHFFQHIQNIQLDLSLRRVDGYIEIKLYNCPISKLMHPKLKSRESNL